MKMSKPSLDLRTSISRKNTSSRKAIPTCSQRYDYNYLSSISKSNTMRLISAKDVKVNNFINMRPPPKTARTTRAALKKKSTKLQTNLLNPIQQLLLQKSDKIKLVFWNQEPSLQYLFPVVISADFIINQDNFWEKLDDSKNV